MANNMMLPLLLVGGIGAGIYWYSMDDTPMGLTVTKVIHPEQPLGENVDGKVLSAKVVTGSFRREDGENTPSVTSILSDKPLLVFLEDDEPVHAEVINYSDIDADPLLITECQTTPPEEDDAEALEEWNTVCDEATTLFIKQINGQWREIAEEAGATEDSINEKFPDDETDETIVTQEAESWLGLKTNNMFINTLQSHQMW